MTQPGVAVAVLAAGRGSRLGGDVPKPLVELRGRPLVSWALEAATGSGLRPVVLVVGHRGDAVGDAATEAVMIVRARRWRRGIARSLRAALKALDPWAQVGAVCIGLADQPLVGADAYRRLADAYRGGAALAVATYGGQRRNPVLLARPVWGEARRLAGDVGARALMGREGVVEVDCTGTGSAADVDTLDDLRSAERALGQGEDA
ncbi:MAG TPA: nucleotidyltransferase family protein [Acidimicrobiia bacterium]|nr:nucleotidyltransferase family protein [Acidimicrobiia bacterium]